VQADLALLGEGGKGLSLDGEHDAFVFYGPFFHPGQTESGLAQLSFGGHVFSPVDCGEGIEAAQVYEKTTVLEPSRMTRSSA
jgi:hypothetical protein